MATLVSSKKAKRVNVYVLGKHVEIINQIENLSAFVQIALEQAPDIMAFAILKGIDPKKYDTGRTLDEVIDEFNEKYPQNELTQKRLGTYGKHPLPRDTDSNQESNPALR